ncbi:hypothetical protein [Kitasatospora sp. NPDC096140]
MIPDPIERTIVINAPGERVRSARWEHRLDAIRELSEDATAP